MFVMAQHIYGYNIHVDRPVAQLKGTIFATMRLQSSCCHLKDRKKKSGAHTLGWKNIKWFLIKSFIIIIHEIACLPQHSIQDIMKLKLFSLKIIVFQKR